MLQILPSFPTLSQRPDLSSLPIRFWTCCHWFRVPLTLPAPAYIPHHANSGQPPSGKSATVFPVPMPAPSFSLFSFRVRAPLPLSWSLLHSYFSLPLPSPTLFSQPFSSIPIKLHSREQLHKTAQLPSFLLTPCSSIVQRYRLDTTALGRWELTRLCHGGYYVTFLSLNFLL